MKKYPINKQEEFKQKDIEKINKELKTDNEHFRIENNRLHSIYANLLTENGELQAAIIALTKSLKRIVTENKEKEGL